MVFTAYVQCLIRIKPNQTLLALDRPLSNWLVRPSFLIFHDQHLPLATPSSRRFDFNPPSPSTQNTQNIKKSARFLIDADIQDPICLTPFTSYHLPLTNAASLIVVSEVLWYERSGTGTNGLAIRYDPLNGLKHSLRGHNNASSFHLTLCLFLYHQQPLIPGLHLQPLLRKLHRYLYLAIL